MIDRIVYKTNRSIAPLSQTYHITSPDMDSIVTSPDSVRTIYIDRSSILELSKDFTHVVKFHLEFLVILPPHMISQAWVRRQA